MDIKEKTKKIMDKKNKRDKWHQRFDSGRNYGNSQKQW